MPWTPLLPTAPATPKVPGWFAVLIMTNAGAIPSGEAFGTVLVQRIERISPAGIPSAEAFGAASVAYTQGILPAAVASLEVFGAATVVRGAVNVAPLAGIPSAEAFGAATLHLKIFPASTISAEAFGAAAVTTGPVVVAPSGIASAEAFGAVTVTPAQYVTVTAGIASAEAFGTTTVVPPTAPPVNFESVGVGKGQQTTALTWTHTIGATAKALVVCVAHYGNTTTPTLTATCGATPMTLLGSRLAYHTDSFGHYAHLAVYGLLNPPTGAQTITCNTNGASIWSVGDSTAYENVTSFGTAVNNGATGTAMTQAVTSAANQMVVQAFASGITSATISAYNRTSRYSKAYVNATNVAFQMGDTAVVSPSFAATISPSTAWASVAVPLVP